MGRDVRPSVRPSFRPPIRPSVHPSVNIFGFFYLLSYNWPDCFETLHDDTRHRSAHSLSPLFASSGHVTQKWGQTLLWHVPIFCLITEPNFVWWYQTLLLLLLLLNIYWFNIWLSNYYVTTEITPSLLSRFETLLSNATTKILKYTNAIKRGNGLSSSFLAVLSYSWYLRHFSICSIWEMTAESVRRYFLKSFSIHPFHHIFTTNIAFESTTPTRTKLGWTIQGRKVFSERARVALFISIHPHIMCPRGSSSQILVFVKNLENIKFQRTSDEATGTRPRCWVVLSVKMSPSETGVIVSVPWSRHHSTTETEWPRIGFPICIRLP